jgi:DNA topoisomerase VI subunit B
MSIAYQPSVGSFDFLVNNLHLFGFDDPQLSLLQSVRELVDNSVDACRLRNNQNNGASPPMHVSVLIDDTKQEYIVLEVSDNGLGMVDIAQTFQIFYSNSSLSTPQIPTDTPRSRIGKYGVGLSATLINSYLCTGAPAQVISKIAQTTELITVEVSVLIEGNKKEPKVTMQRSIICEDSQRSGATIRLKLANMMETEFQQGQSRN